MNGFEKLKKEIEGQKDGALIATVDYLLTRNDMEEKYLNQEKSINEMAKFIKSKGTKYLQNGWNYITNEVVFAWAIMYYSFPNSFLKIEEKKVKKNTSTNTSNVTKKNNVIEINKAKEQLEKKKEIEQISLFGGVTN